MNWLQIARRIRKEADLSGTDTAPASVVGQSGEMLLVINWMSSAWLSIQGLKLWDWMWEAGSATVLAGTSSVAQTVSATRYVKDTLYAGTTLLTYMPWAEFRTAYPAATLGDGDPSVWTVRPDRAIAVNAKPLADLTLTFERYREPQPIGGDTDSPAMPENQHEAIVWRAVMFYAGFDEAGGTYQHARSEYQTALGLAALADLPDFEFGSPLC